MERFGIDALTQTVARLVDDTSGLDDLLDRLLGVVHAANGGDLSDDVAILGISHSRQHTE